MSESPTEAEFVSAWIALRPNDSVEYATAIYHAPVTIETVEAVIQTIETARD